jgi:hypothetical protein
MLGEQIMELKGKIIGQRVLDAEGPIMETTLTQTGNVKETQVNETATFVAKPMSSGVIGGEGQGVIMVAGESEEIATFKGYGVGRVTPSGSVKWRGSHFFRTSSQNGKLAFLNNAVGLFEAEIDTNGNMTEKVWEWK